MSYTQQIKRDLSGDCFGELADLDIDRGGEPYAERQDDQGASTMGRDWPSLKVRIANRLARHFGADPFTLSNQHPMVSFTFDDAPVSAVTTGAALLEEHNAKGTFYVSGGLTERHSDHWTTLDAADILRLHRSGHEIGCHTFSHQRVTDLDDAAMAEEISNNNRYLKSLDPSIEVGNFAYPYGTGSLARKKQLSRSFRSSRSIFPGINSGTIDLQYLLSMPLIDNDIDRDRIERALDETVAKNGWLIFYGHDVQEKPSPYGCTPALLRFALEAAARRNIAAVPVADALKLSGA